MFGGTSTVVLFLMLGQAATVADTLTAESLRAWWNVSGVSESNAKLIHDQMQRQKVGLPPWWPDDVYAQEEDAMQSVDLVEAAVPFYQSCFTESQARLLAKMAGSTAGQKVAKSALQTHGDAALQGASPTEAQAAGEEAAAKTAHSVTPEEKQKLMASLTPAERAMGAHDFAPERFAAMQACMNKAYAQTIKVVQSRQETAIRAVIEANRPKLEATEAKYVKEHAGPVK